METTSSRNPASNERVALPMPALFTGGKSGYPSRRAKAHSTRSEDRTAAARAVFVGSIRTAPAADYLEMAPPETRRPLNGRRLSSRPHLVKQ